MMSPRVAIVVGLVLALGACQTSSIIPGQGAADPCVGQTCGGHGLCAVAQGTAICVCDAGFHAWGLACIPDDPTAPCTGVDCGPGGTCAVVSGAPSCTCGAGYHRAGATTCLPDAVDGGAPGQQDGGTTPQPDGGAPGQRDGGTPTQPDGGTTPQPDGGTPPQSGTYFPAGAPWYTDISAAALDGESAQVISGLQAAGGWGTGTMRIDFSIEVLEADASTPMRTFEPTDDFYSPDCDEVQMPVPLNGVLEGETGYECTTDGDCHLIVVHRPTMKLYEMWRANISGGTFYGGCLAVWDMTRVYPANGRGDQCTSADAAGYPIAPLLFTADEVASGSVDHAIRFILPNARIRNGVYVHPATHSTGATSGGSGTPPYGARFRLRADYPLASLPSDGARAVARGLQRYGMFLSDGGNIALTAQSDRLTTAKWSGLLDSYDLSDLKVSDFQMVDGGARVAYTGDCVRQ
jgi:serine/threonine-protein kinase